MRRTRHRRRFHTDRKTAFPTTTPTADAAMYDAAGQIGRIELGRAGAAAATLDYEYHASGQLKKATTTGLPGAGVDEFAYDQGGRLAHGGVLDFAYDLAENPTKLGATDGLTYDAAGQLQTADASEGMTTFGFDAAGARTSAQPAGAAARTYAYDAAGRLSAVTQIGRPTVQFGYDGTGLRNQRKIGADTTRFVWDTSGAVPMLLAEGGTSYIYGPDGLPLAGIDADNRLRYYHHDRLGSTRQVTDEAGTVVAEQTYDAYGQIAGRTGTARVPFGFAGEYTEEATGLIYLRARFYDPATGQFLTRDPFEAITGQPYLYAGGDPVNATDPLGLFPSLGKMLSDVGGALDSVASDVSALAGGVAAGAGMASLACTAAVVTLPACGMIGAVAAGAGAVAVTADAYLLIRGRQSANSMVFNLLGVGASGVALRGAARFGDEVALHLKAYAWSASTLGYVGGLAEDWLDLNEECASD